MVLGRVATAARRDGGAMVEGRLVRRGRHVGVAGGVGARAGRTGKKKNRDDWTRRRGRGRRTVRWLQAMVQQNIA